ncbi:MAG: cyclophilin-like fold protein [bacterium]|nr:cyclophilin-like fold protein [bacterium]
MKKKTLLLFTTAALFLAAVFCLLSGGGPRAAAAQPGGERIRLRFEGGEAIVRLEDNAAARDLAARLPLTQTFEDFNNIEKICRLPEKLDTAGVRSGVDPGVADVTLYKPWNTLVFYYKDFGYHDDLAPIGHVESGMEQLAAMGGSFRVTMERAGGRAAAKTTAITMTVKDTVITASLDDSETTRAFLATLPRTIGMKRYGGREYYGRIAALPQAGEAVADFRDGDVTYYPAGPSLAVFYAGEDRSNQSGLIRMGRITSELSAFERLGDEVEVRIEIANRGE